MTRFWTGFLDAVAAILPLPLVVLLLLVAAGVLGLLLYFFPKWVPRRLPRFHRPHWRLRWPTWRWGWRRRKHGDSDDLERAIDELEASDEELPDLAPEVFISLADRLAAQGRYAEAIRERLRGIVRDLVNRSLIEHRPGWTVTELAVAAAAARPAVDRPLSEGTGIFSDIWYGQRPASADHDARMRVLTAQVTESLNADRVGVAT
jgi:hypothetical protein